MILFYSLLFRCDKTIFYRYRQTEKKTQSLSCNFQVLKVTMQITVTLQSIGKTNKFDWGIRGFQVKYAPGFTPRKLHDSFCSMSILSTLNCLFFEVR